jgi:TolB protein
MRVRIIAASIVVAVGVPASADPNLQRPVLRTSQPMRIALPDFAAAGASEIAFAKSLSRTIASDLKQSGAFELVDQVAFLAKEVRINVLPEFADWRKTSAQELVVGRITRELNGHIHVEFRLWDVSSGTQLTGQQYFCDPDDLSRIGHIISSDIYQRVTNEKHTFE